MTRPSHNFSLARLTGSILVGLLLCSGSAGAQTEPLPAGAALEQLVTDATSPASDVSGPARRRLRAAGPAGLEALMERGRALIDRPGADVPAPGIPESGALREAIDEVAQQKDAWASGLYWFTDLEAAIGYAGLEGRPILSLRLLGRLTDDESCANSRFFRTGVYPSERLARLLSQNFVLHWESVGPVPIVTIDHGHGRVDQRPLTGNSVHFVLSPAGRPVDVLPGLISAIDMERELIAARTLLLDLRRVPKELRQEFVGAWHRRALEQEVSSNRVSRSPSPGESRALAADRLTRSKSVVERPLLVGLGTAATSGQSTPRTAGPAGAVPASRLRIGGRSRTLIAWKLGLFGEFEDFASMPAPVLAAFSRLCERFAADIAADTEFNLRTLRPIARVWFANREVETGDLSRLNARVYAELFRMPLGEPALAPLIPDAFDGLDRDR